MKQSIIKFTAIFILQVFLSVNTVCAQIESLTPTVSYLSPALNISVGNFDQSFRSYFSEQSSILNQPDTTQSRIQFTNDLYILPFKSLFPQILQYQLFQGIKQNLLKQVDVQEIVDIKVEYVSNDSVYALFKQHGEKKLSGLIGNQKLKEQLLPIKQIRNKEWIALEGYNPPSKKRAKPETIEKYKRKWLLESISGFTGYSKKELKEKTTGALWIIYFQYKLAHEFGQRLIRDVEDGRAVEFKVNISLKTANDIEAYVSISGKDFKTTINQTKGAIVDFQSASVLLESFKPLTFEQRIEKIQDENFRQQMHILQSQKLDLIKVVEIIDSLKRIKDIDLADWQKGISAEVQAKVKQDLTAIDSWLSITPEFVNGRQQEKYQAHSLLEQIIKKQGKLAYENFAAVIENVENAITVLDARVIFLFRRISNRNIQLLTYAIENKDDYFYSEVIKNELVLAQEAVKIDLLSIALSKIEYIDVEILNNPVFKDKVAKNNAAVAAIKLLRQKLNKADDAKLASKAIKLVNQLEIDKARKIDLIIKDLQSTKRWLEDKQFTKSAAELMSLINQLNAAKEQNISFYQVLDNCLKWIDNLNKNINSSTRIESDFKNIIINKFVRPKAMLKDMLGKVSLRNKAIRQVLPVQQLTDFKQVIGLLENDFQQKSGYDSFEFMQADLIEQMQYAVKSLSGIQGGFKRSSEIARVGDIIPGIIQRLSQPLYNEQMLGQAI